MDLKDELNKTLSLVDGSIRRIETIAARNGCRPEELRDQDGNLPLIPALVAKSNILLALVQIEIGTDNLWIDLKN